MNLTKRIRKGFSMVELLLLLLFVSLITAALTPVVTKKHFKMPRPTNHGAYLCYYRLITDANGKVTGKKLHEARFSGKALTTKVFDRDVDKCTFEPPQQVSYFHISAIGGGGGGGDSGYTGGSYSTMGPFSESLDPFDITDYMISEAQRDITAGDFANYGGQLYGFVHGAASGKGGDQLYAERDKTTPCTINHTETHTYTYTHVVTKTTCKKWTEYTVDDSGSGSGGTGSGGTGGTGSGGTGSGSSNPLPESDPDDSSSTGSESLDGTDSDNSGPNDNHSPGSTPNPGNGNKHDKPGVSNGGGGYWGTAHGNGSVTDSGGKKGPGSNGLNGGFGLWVPGKGHHGHDTYNIQDKKLKLNLPEFRFYNPNNEVAMLHSKYAFLFSSRDLLAYTYKKCTGGYETTETTYTRTSVDVDTICDEHRDYYSFSTATNKGGAGAPGATCRSSYFQGGVGLKYVAENIPARGKDGDDNYPSYTLTPGYDYPPAESFQCIGKAEDGEVISKPESSTIKIGRGNNLETVSAQNATGAGEGATCDKDYKPKDGTAGTSCNIAPVTEGCSPGRYGYCLQRWGRSTWEANEKYNFVFTYSQNYLQYGLAGEQGQYKTMVIRSFKDKTADITIGLGGAKGTNGGNGSDGKTTTFGDIITAEGGLGGEGGQLTAPEWLTGYRSGAENWPAGITNAEFVNGKRIVREEGGKEPEKPKPNNLSSNILNFLAPQDNENIAKIMEDNKIGYGGKGGGSRHNCWFGEYRKWLDSPSSSPNTTPHQTSQPNQHGELAHSYPLPPDACRNNHERIEANDGQAGAVIIRW